MQMFAKAFIGFDPMDIEGAHQLMDSIIYSNGSAKCAFDIALYDIIGKVKGLPLYKVSAVRTRLFTTTSPLVLIPRLIMIGGSYLGYVQWAAAASKNPHLKAMVSEVCAGSAFVDMPYRGGTLSSGM